MHFWTKSPGPHFSHYIKSVFAGPKEPELLSSATTATATRDNERWMIRHATMDDAEQIIQFWRDHFRRPASPLCLYDLSELQTQITSYPTFILLIAINKENNKIIGTIMSQSLGQIKRVGISRNWTSFNVRWIDMFCVHYEFWNKGIGSALLNTLYVEHERNGDAACFFMKEGGPLKMPAIRSSSYAFRVIKNFDSLRLSPKIEPWTINNFLNYAQALPEKTNCFIHNNCGDKTKIFCYNGFRGRIIAAFVKGHEHDYEGHYPIIWSSGYLKHDALLDSEVNEAAKLLSEAAALSFNSPYIWMDARHVGKNSMANSDLWSYDGSYHMYAYHMDTGIYFNAEPFLIL